MPGTAMDVQLGLKAEATFGTAVTVDQFPEGITKLVIKRAMTTKQGGGFRAGRRAAPLARRVVVGDGATVVIEQQAMIKGLGAFFKAALGDVTNTAIPSATGAYQQVHTPKASDPIASYTLQGGIPHVGAGTAANPETVYGAWCESIEISNTAEDFVMVKTSWGAKGVETTTALATASYATGNDLFTFCHGALKVGGTLTGPTTTALATSTGTDGANVTGFSLTFSNGLNGDRRYYGGACRVGAIPTLGEASVSGSITVEYTDSVLRDAYMNQTQLALMMTFTHTTTIGTGTPVPAALQIVVPGLKLDGELPEPNVDGSPIRTTMNFTGGDVVSAGVPLLYVVYRTSDTAP